MGLCVLHSIKLKKKQTAQKLRAYSLNTFRVLIRYKPQMSNREDFTLKEYVSCYNRN